jgi:hypothetical protein
MCSVGGKPTEVKVRNLVAWIEGERETESLVYGQSHPWDGEQVIGP